MNVCPHCGHVLVTAAQLTDRELDVLSAWWAVRSVKKSASIVGVGEQRAKNLLARVRQRVGVTTTMEAAEAFVGQLRPLRDVGRRAA